MINLVYVADGAAGYRALCGINPWHLMDVCDFEVASSISSLFVST